MGLGRIVMRRTLFATAPIAFSPARQLGMFEVIWVWPRFTPKISLMDKRIDHHQPVWPAVWTNGFAHLGPVFYTELPPQGLPQPRWIARNEALALSLGMDTEWFASPPSLDIWAGNTMLPGMTPLASVYSGHQFGVWAGQLGDGRAHLLGEIEDASGNHWEIQLKGAGSTPYSRMGDGRAVLRSSVREFLCSEAMHALGIPTTRALALVGSSLPVRREAVESAAVVTRVAPSFIRFGHFEHFGHRGQIDALRQLADFVIEQYRPACRKRPEPYAALLDGIAAETARLVAQWQAVGFCHGVMNTDNMSILGLTLDYGPFGFMEGFDPSHICNHSDTHGRYAYARQPDVALWNVQALAVAMLPLLSSDSPAAAALQRFRDVYVHERHLGMCHKLGLTPQDDTRADDARLWQDWLSLLAAGHIDYTIVHRTLSRLDFARLPSKTPQHHALRDLFLDRAGFDGWFKRYENRLNKDPQPDPELRGARLLKTNPKFVLRNYMAQEAIEAAEQGDSGPLEALHAVLRDPFGEHPEHALWAKHPPTWAQTLEVSCSS